VASRCGGFDGEAPGTGAPGAVPPGDVDPLGSDASSRTRHGNGRSTLDSPAGVRAGRMVNGKGWRRRTGRPRAGAPRDVGDARCIGGTTDAADVDRETSERGLSATYPTRFTDLNAMGRAPGCRGL
jgi:hypothetical protein